MCNWKQPLTHLSSFLNFCLYIVSKWCFDVIKKGHGTFKTQQFHLRAETPKEKKASPTSVIILLHLKKFYLKICPKKLVRYVCNNLYKVYTLVYTLYAMVYTRLSCQLEGGLWVFSCMCTLGPLLPIVIKHSVALGLKTAPLPPPIILYCKGGTEGGVQFRPPKCQSTLQNCDSPSPWFCLLGESRRLLVYMILFWQSDLCRGGSLRESVSHKTRSEGVSSLWAPSRLLSLAPPSGKRVTQLSLFSGSRLSLLLFMYAVALRILFKILLYPSYKYIPINYLCRKCGQNVQNKY